MLTLLLLLLLALKLPNPCSSMTEKGLPILAALLPDVKAFLILSFEFVYLKDSFDLAIRKESFDLAILSDSLEGTKRRDSFDCVTEDDKEGMEPTEAL